MDDNGGADLEPPKKRARVNDDVSEEPSRYSSFAMRQMAKMGHVEGKGLGKHEQGRSEIVSQTRQLGRRGLGMNIVGFEASEEEWTFEEMPTSLKETPDWIPSCPLPIPTLTEMANWSLEGKTKLIIEDETNFCSDDTLQSVLECKTVFDTLEGDEFLKARTRANPFETVKGVIFQNRAAMKMANIDNAFNFMFTYPRTSYPHGELLVGQNDLLYFADICAGPGGFSEYVLWRRQENMAKGFGLTLKSGEGVNDFKLDEFFAAPVEFFEPHYGVGGVEGDGDIMRADNLTAFQTFVLSQTDQKGVHFVMGDGGFSVKNQENIQEILTKQLLLCQFLCALSILREGGHFMCKTFDLFTPFSVGLIYLLYRVFDHVCIFKPVTSRPANSERYVVCQGLRKGSSAMHDYLFTINSRLNKLKEEKSVNDVLEVVPLTELLADQPFASYMRESNEKIGKAQAKALRKLQIFVRNATLAEPNQAEVRKMCLEQWQIPDEARAAPHKMDAAQTFEYLWGNSDSNILHRTPSSMSLDVLENVHDWRCCLVGGQRLILLGLGKNHVYVCDQEAKMKWIKKNELQSLDLPKKTLLEVDLVTEYQREGKGQRHKYSVYVIDAMVIFGKDVRSKHYKDRLRLVEKLTKAVNKPSRPYMVPIRVHQVVELAAVDKVFSRLCLRQVKGRRLPRLACEVDDRFFCPRGLFFFRHLKEPWSQGLSKRTGKPFFFNPETKTSVLVPPPEALASYSDCLKSRVVWSWDEHNLNLQSELAQPLEDAMSETDVNKIGKSPLSKETLMVHIKQKLTS